MDIEGVLEVAVNMAEKKDDDDDEARLPWKHSNCPGTRLEQTALT